MSLFDVQQRTDIILKKYAQYDSPTKSRRDAGQGDDPFNDEYDAMQQQIDDLIKQAADNEKEDNRAAVAARNAEIRKAKQSLLSEGIDGLQRRVKKGRGITKALVEDRQRRVKLLIDRIYSVPDGMGGNRRPFKIGAFVGGGEKTGGPIVISSGGPGGQQASDPHYYKSTEETERFEREWEVSKRKQDCQLDRIEKGVVSLSDMAKGMQEELDKQSPIIDDVDRQLNSVTSRLKDNNARLTGLVLQMRNKRNFCIDITLVIILLAIVAYIISMFQKRSGH